MIGKVKKIKISPPLCALLRSSTTRFSSGSASAFRDAPCLIALALILLWRRLPPCSIFRQGAGGSSYYCPLFLFYHRQALSTHSSGGRRENRTRETEEAQRREEERSTDKGGRWKDRQSEKVKGGKDGRCAPRGGRATTISPQQPRRFERERKKRNSKRNSRAENEKEEQRKQNKKERERK